MFISHASEDKEEFVRPLAHAIRRQHVQVWYDEFDLSVGDSLRSAIDAGLAKADFGVVVLSENFFAKSWPLRELEGLLAKETAGARKVILPIWHNIAFERVVHFSPSLAGVHALQSQQGLDAVVRDLLKVIRPSPSPLVLAREELLRHWSEVPDIAEEWWLDIVEFKERTFKYPGTGFVTQWMFPLPFPEDTTSAERGANLAAAALQYDWQLDAEDQKISQFTPPGQVLEFIHSWSGLYETAREHPDILAIHAPQLTLRGCDDGFADVFDNLLKVQNEYPAKHHTIDGENARCVESVAWRHETFGNYNARELAQSFSGKGDTYMRPYASKFLCVAWLLSRHSSWMPNRLREYLLDGFAEGAFWLDETVGDSDNAFVGRLYGPRSKFRPTRAVREGLAATVEKALSELGLIDDADAIAAGFLSRRFVSAYYDRQDEMRRRS
ncbi:MAG: toll/interleukin-1 receptor domain-containing protein [Terricaulis sp.]